MVDTIAVLGAGQMGAGIAQVAAQVGIDVVLIDVDRAAVDRGLERIKGSLDRLVQKEKIDETQRSETSSRISTRTEISGLAQSDFVIEAVSENESLKKKVWAQVDEVAGPNTIYASNTSSISITRLAAATSRPERFIGMHFMNPVPVMKLVEVIAGLQTDESTVDATLKLAERMGKQTVRSADQPGFIVNRILMPMINEAVGALQEGLGTVEDIDAGMKLGTNQPMGPLTLADFIGLDTCLAIMEVLHEGIGDPRHRPSPLLRRYVDAGWLGRKSGRGFYIY